MLAIGNAVHAALERFFGLPLESRSEELLQRALRSVWRTHCPRGTFANLDEEAQAGTDALALLSLFAEQFDLSVQPLAREQWLSRRLGPVELVGKLDRVDEVNDREIRILDFKTGRSQLAEDDLPTDSAAQVYLLLAEGAFGRQVESVRFVYLASGSEVCWHPEREDTEAAAERVLSLVSAITSDSAFEAVPGPHCRWCPFALACPERQQVTVADLVVPEGIAF